MGDIDAARKLFEQEMTTVNKNDIANMMKQLFMLYDSAIKAGFSKEDAMEIIKFMIKDARERCEY